MVGGGIKGDQSDFDEAVVVVGSLEARVCREWAKTRFRLNLLHFFCFSTATFK